MNAFLGIADAECALARAGAVMAAVVAKGMSGRPKTVERATETCLLLCELECAEVVVAALVDKGTKHKVPKCALASTNTMDKWILAAANGLVDFARREVNKTRRHSSARTRPFCLPLLLHSAARTPPSCIVG